MQNSSDYQCRVTGLEDYPLGFTATEAASVFRLYSPKATSVEVVIFDQYEDSSGLTFEMEKDQDGVWSCLIQDHFHGNWYAYKIEGPVEDHFFLSTDELIADPRSRHVTTKNHYLQYPKTKISYDSTYDWENDAFVAPKDPRDLIIYETHIK